MRTLPRNIVSFFVRFIQSCAAFHVGIWMSDAEFSCVQPATPSEFREFISSLKVYHENINIDLKCIIKSRATSFFRRADFLRLFPTGEECELSCRDISNDVVILPSNMTVSSIMRHHWMNPTKVKVCVFSRCAAAQLTGRECRTGTLILRVTQCLRWHRSDSRYRIVPDDSSVSFVNV